MRTYMLHDYIYFYHTRQEIKIFHISPSLGLLKIPHTREFGTARELIRQNDSNACFFLFLFLFFFFLEQNSVDKQCENSERNRNR